MPRPEFFEPDFSDERMRGAHYRIVMNYFHHTLPHLYRLEDISIKTLDEFFEPGQNGYAIAFVPRGYFPEDVLEAATTLFRSVDTDPEYPTPIIPDDNPDKLTAMYLRYLLERRRTSTKSKLAQSGWEIIANFGTDPYLNFPIEVNERGFYFPVWIWNHNPKVTFRTPNKPFPAFRFFIPNKPLVGQELLSETKKMCSSGIALEDLDANFYRPHELEELGSTHPLLSTKSSDYPVSSLIVPIEREADFTEEKVVDIQDLLGCPSKDREMLDKIWGLKWRKPGDWSPPVSGSAIQISESAPLVMSEAIAGVIDVDYNWLNNFEYLRPPEHGLMRHITSPLIDPRFGFPDGQPIRFEYWKRGVFDHNFHFVRMFLHRSN